MLRLTRAHVREIDRLSLEAFHIPTIVLMENAARNAAEIAWEMIRRRAGAHVVIFCGSGNNGGDGLAIARHLHNRGVNIEIYADADAERSPNAQAQWDIVRAMELEHHPFDEADVALASAPDLVIDALLGTGATSAPRGATATAIDLILAQCTSPILAIDVPSGLDCDTGLPLGPCIRATVTVTFVAEKAGFANPDALAFLGEVIVADIGCPRELVERIAEGDARKM